MTDRLRIGHLAFGAAFIAIGITWLLRGGGLGVDAGWLLTVTAASLGLAGVLTAVAAIVRPRR